MPSEQLARDMTAAYVDDTDGLGLGRPDHEPLASETIDGIVALIADLVERGPRLPRGRRRLLPRAELRRYGKLSNRPLEDMQQGEGDDAAALKENPQDFALWKGAQGGRGHRLALAVGRGAPGLAHRVLGDGRGGAGHRLRDPRRRLRPGLSPPRERDRPDRGGARASRWPASGCTTAWCASRARRWPSRSGNIALLHEALEQYGAADAGHVLRRRPLPPAAGLLARRARRRPRRRGHAARADPPPGPRRRPSPRASPSTPSASGTTWPTTSTPRPRAASCSSGCARPTGGWTGARRWASARCASWSGPWASSRCSRADEARPTPTPSG